MNGWIDVLGDSTERRLGSQIPALRDRTSRSLRSVVRPSPNDLVGAQSVGQLARREESPTRGPLLGRSGGGGDQTKPSRARCSSHANGTRVSAMSLRAVSSGGRHPMRMPLDDIGREKRISS